jgi:gamma-glutamylaminecyclotransferase
MLQNVFVYGTLKRGCCNHDWMRGQRFVGEVWTQPCYRLFDLGGYPGLILDEDAGYAVFGEVWEVDSAGLKRLDLLEGLEVGEYHRVEMLLAGDWTGRGVIGYLYALPVDEAEELGDGVWREVWVALDAGGE